MTAVEIDVGALVAAFVAHCRECVNCIGVMTIAAGEMCRVGSALYRDLPLGGYWNVHAALRHAISLTCDYSTPGNYTRPPEYCDSDAEPGSVYCAAHLHVEDGDNSDEPVWAMEAD